MEDISAGFFWIFLAAVVSISTWRKTVIQRDELAMIRALIERGQTVDPALLDKVLRAKSSHDKDGGPLKAGFVVFATGGGMAAMGYFLKIGGNPEALYPLLGIAALLGLVGLALIVGWWIEERRDPRPR